MTVGTVGDYCDLNPHARLGSSFVNRTPRITQKVAECIRKGPSNL
jgi:hypothetical protein